VSRKNRKDLAITPVKAIVPPYLNSTPLGIRTDVSPDSVLDSSVFWSGAEDFLDVYNKPTWSIPDRRNLLLALAKRCSAWQRGIMFMASEMAVRDLVITPTSTNPSASDLLEAERVIGVINNAMLRTDGSNGLSDFFFQFVSGLFGSKTGCFIPFEGTLDRITGFSMLQHTLPFPAWNTNEDGIPNTEYVEGWPTPTGIWYIERRLSSLRNNWGSFHYRDKSRYIQLTAFGSPARQGAFRDQFCPLEMCMSEVASYIATSDLVRRTLGRTDSSQLVLLNNIDETKLQKALKAREMIVARIKNGEDVPDGERNLRLTVTARDTDKTASISAEDLRSFPTDLSWSETLEVLSQLISLSMGLDKRHLAPSTIRNRLDSASQAAIENSDDPGLKLAIQQFEHLVSGTLLYGTAASGKLTSNASAETRMRVDTDAKIAQVMATLGLDVKNDEVAKSYAIRQGLLRASDFGQTDPLRTSEGLTKSFARLVDHQGNPIRYEHIQEISSKKLATKADPENWQKCYDSARARVDDWIQTELPSLVDKYGLNKREFTADIDALALELGRELRKCAWKAAGKTRDPIITAKIDNLVDSFTLLIGSPQITRFSIFPPRTNLYEQILNMAPDLAIGRKSVDDVTKQAETWANKNLFRSFNATNSIGYETMAKGHPGPVEWKLNTSVQNCSQCLKIAGEYPSLADMLIASDGEYPSSPRLLCSGNCHCRIVLK